MPRKRKRSAYTALSSARVHRYQPHQTARTHSSTTIHVTPTPPEPISEFESSQPSPHTPTSTPAPIPIHLPSNNNNTTPLVLRAADVASVQAALGFTPDTPADSLIYLGTDDQRRARDLINSPNASPSNTPPTVRRLSLGSTVTPIPLNLESPQPEQPVQQPTQQPIHQRPHPPLPSHHPPPSPITPHHQLHIPSPPPSPNLETVDHLHSDALIDPAPLANLNKPVKPLHNPASKPHVPPSNPVPAPLFTTGKGKPLAPLTSRRLANASMLLNTAPSAAPRPPNPLVRSLFSTGKGRPLDIRKTLIPPSPLNRTPLADTTNQTSLFTTGNGKPMPLPPKPTPPTSLLHPPLSTSRIAREQHSTVRKVLFSDSAPATKKSSVPLRNLANTPLQRKYQPRTPLKTTPFRHPRRVLPTKPTTSVPSTTSHNPAIPRWHVPRLSTSGPIFCDLPSHSERHLQSQIQSRERRVLDFLSTSDTLQTCLQFVFEKEHFGRYNCLPTDVVQYFQFKDLASFSVGNLLSWTRSLFPTTVEKPASCFGSAAWTRMSYSLAIWKLARLESQKATNENATTETFLSTANVLREILRRIESEWHSNRQPHLLRIMRKDSNPASHLVLVVCGFELAADDRIFAFLSDGWYIVRATFDGILETRIWRGKLRVGEKVSIVGAVLQERQEGRTFFFGDGDELGASVLRLSANGVRKASASIPRLGWHPYPWSGSLRWLKDDGGKGPNLKVVILRSYPVFYMETIPTVDTENRRFTFRRAEGEDQAREAHEERARREQEVETHSGEKNQTDCQADKASDQRDVRPVKEILICGINDDPNDSSARKLVRVYSISEPLQAMMETEGGYLLLSKVVPKKNTWTCKPDGVHRALGCNQTSSMTANVLSMFPRRVCSVPQLRGGAVADGHDFDGVFLVLYVTPDRSNRFAYLTSAPTEAINVLALQLSDADAECLPTALRFKQETRPGFAIIGIRDARFCYRDNKLDILHANSTMRTSFLVSRSLTRMCRSNPLRQAYDDLETQIKGKKPQLEVLRDAIISFASGNRSSVSAYFTSTQEMC